MLWWADNFMVCHYIQISEWVFHSNRLIYFKNKMSRQFIVCFFYVEILVGMLINEQKILQYNYYANVWNIIIIVTLFC